MVIGFENAEPKKEEEEEEEAFAAAAAADAKLYLYELKHRRSGKWNDDRRCSR